ncbi:hypothetical protein BH10PAT4_BH10PAT4_4850 [soil metagenome]
MKAPPTKQPNYEALRMILQQDLGKSVDLDTARKIGQWLLRFYSHLAE